MSGVTFLASLSARRPTKLAWRTEPLAVYSAKAISATRSGFSQRTWRAAAGSTASGRSEEHTSELQSLMRISYAVFCLKKKRNKHHERHTKSITTRHSSYEHICTTISVNL